jgi:pimeloyl-ACP methyl ester carboxylesterase
VARFVLVHGAWHGAWCFRYVVEELEARGHEALAVDLPCDTVGLTQDDYAVLVGPQPDAVLVGHSMGAQTIALLEAATRVYLGGVLPVEDASPACFVPGFGGAVRDELDRSYWPDADVCAERLYPDCTRAQSDWAFARLRPQARIAFRAAPFGAGDVVIATMRDRAIDPHWQVAQARRHGATLIELDSGHSPFFTQPGELAEILTTLGATSSDDPASRRNSAS